MNIGVFDSGLGGLTILRELLKKLPQYNYIYLGDNARVPYGGKSKKLIYQYTLEALEFLFQKNCLIVILACNTATAIALRKIQQEYLPKHYWDRRVLGVIRPTVETVVEGKFKSVGVMGTYATVISKSFEKELKKFNKDIQIYQQACPLLVPIIEEGEVQWDGLDSILKKYLEPLKKENIDSLILGCTHYGHIDEKIQNVVGNTVQIISEEDATMKKFKNYLIRHQEIEQRLRKEKKRTYYLTDLTNRYKKMVKVYLRKYFGNGRLLKLARI
ncbi:glutamate racemase [Candidatus Roizmanbacteria bacterium]|nr:glutamate racemase [Candidatus Roizmanbacteria bacterium]